MKHAHKTPYTVHHDQPAIIVNGNYPAHFIKTDDGETPICTIWAGQEGNPASQARQRATADFVAQACNCHSELITKLKEISRWLHETNQFHGAMPKDFGLPALIKKASAPRTKN